MSNLLLKKIKAFIRILRPEITLLGMVSVYIGAQVADSTLFSFKLLLAMLAVFFVGAGSQPFNDYFDFEIDKIVHPNRPLTSGVFKRETGLYIGVTFFIMGLILSFFVNVIVFLLAIIGVTLIFLYELVSKKVGFIGNIVVAFTIAISFTYGGAVVGNLVKPTFFTLVAFFIMLGREVLLDVRDFEGDKEERSTLPVRIGRKNAAYFAIACLFFSMFLLYIPGLLIFESMWYLLLTIPLVVVTVYGSVLPFLDVEYSARATDILRFSMIQGLLLFIFIIFL